MYPEITTGVVFPVISVLNIFNLQFIGNITLSDYLEAIKITIVVRT